VGLGPPGHVVDDALADAEVLVLVDRLMASIPDDPGDQLGPPAVGAGATDEVSPLLGHRDAPPPATISLELSLPPRLPPLHDVLDRQPNQLRMDSVADPTQHFPLDRVGLATDPRREVPPPAVIKGGHLGEACGLTEGDPVADPALQVSGEFFEHPS